MKLNSWRKDRRFVVSRVLKREKDRAQLSLLQGDEFEYFYFMTHTELLLENVVISNKVTCFMTWNSRILLSSVR